MGLKRHQVQLKWTATVPLLLLTPLRSLSKQFITSLTHAVFLSRDGRVCCVVPASLCGGERTVQDWASAKRHKNRCRSRGREVAEGGNEGPCVAWVRPFVSPRALHCSSSRRHFRPASSFFVFFLHSLILSPFLCRPHHYRRRRRFCCLALISGRPVGTQ